MQLTVYWEESRYRYPTGKSYVIQSLRFQSARFWVPFWNDAVFPKSRSVLLLLFFSICQNKCCFYQLSHFLYWYKLYPLICSAQTTAVLAAWCILISVVSVCSCTLEALSSFRGLRELRDINAQKVCLVVLCKNAENSSTVCIYGYKIFIAEYFQVMTVQCCCVTLFWVIRMFSLLTRPK